MKRRVWSNRKKALIVLSGLKGVTLSEICTEHGISQSQYYLWRDQFLSNIDKVFEKNKLTKKEQCLEQENKKLKSLIGELAFELKKARSKDEKRKL